MPSANAETPAHGNANGPGPEPGSLPSKDRFTALAGVGLALVSPVTWGVTALPAFALCARALWRRRYRGLAVVGLLTGAVLGFHGCPLLPPPAWAPDAVTGYYANRHMTFAGRPPIPPSARDIRYRARGIHCPGLSRRSLHLRFEAPQRDVAAFVEGMKLGEGLQYYANYSLDPGPPGVNWWDPAITQEWTKYTLLGDPLGYEVETNVFHDADTGTVLLVAWDLADD